MGADLRQQVPCLAFGGAAEEHGAEPQPTTDGFVDDTQTFDRDVPIRGEFAACKGLAKFFYQCVMATLDGP